MSEHCCACGSLQVLNYSCRSWAAVWTGLCISPHPSREGCISSGQIPAEVITSFPLSLCLSFDLTVLADDLTFSIKYSICLFLWTPGMMRKVLFIVIPPYRVLFNFSLPAPGGILSTRCGCCSVSCACTGRGTPTTGGILMSLLWQGPLQMSGQQSRGRVWEGKWWVVAWKEGEDAERKWGVQCFPELFLFVSPTYQGGGCGTTCQCGPEHILMGSEHWLLCTVCLPQHEYLTFCSR